MADTEQDLRHAPVADYMRIRHYVVSLAERSSTAIMLPPMSELASNFGVTRMTVHKALKDLIRDKYLISRKGIGTFINKAKCDHRSQNARTRFCVGLVTGSGKNCFYDSFYWSLMSAFGKEITDRSHSVKIINLTETSPDKLAAEVRNNWVDGIIWISFDQTAEETMKILHAEKFPVVAAYTQAKDINCVRIDFERHAYETGSALLREGRRNLIFAALREHPAVKAQLAGMRRAFSDAGVKFNEKFVLKDISSIQDDLGNILDFGIEIHAVYAAGACLSRIIPELVSRGVDIKKQCRVIAEPFVYDLPGGFHGQIREYPLAEMAAAAADMMERMVTGQDFLVADKVFEFKIKTL